MKVLKDFFVECAKIHMEDNLLKVELPDGRSFEVVTTGALKYHNPNAKPLAPFDFRDFIGRPTDDTDQSSS